MTIDRLLRVVSLMGAALLLTPAVAAAYGGPGSAISAIGAFLAVVAALAAALLGFVWFPIKKLLRWISRRGNESAESHGSEPL